MSIEGLMPAMIADRDRTAAGVTRPVVTELRAMPQTAAGRAMRISSPCCKYAPDTRLFWAKIRNGQVPLLS